MKNLMLSLVVVALSGVVTVNANAHKPVIAKVQLQDEKKPVKVEELPDAVKATLASDDYKEWKADKAFWVKPATGAEYYEVELKKGEEAKTVKLDKDGKVVA
ncbi:intein N-terminal splicing region [Chitinophaga rupis]|uniref:Intein N-terminal splicing region n=1 Tax=Chitinophaga rupis TaxID=573321 RepID=A0A1H7M116_9BACT|nr:hypothetical protein [Chitinophaga rupis]SEL04287.1 intein N-terminal splicing region [Chitinophaga rupis]